MPELVTEQNSLNLAESTDVPVSLDPVMWSQACLGNLARVLSLKENHATLCIRELTFWDGEVPQRAKCMLCGSEELSSDPQYPLEKLSVVAHVTSALGTSLAVMAVSESV